MRGRRLFSMSTRDIDQAVERDQERRVAEYEAEQDRLQADADAREAWLESIEPREAA